MSLSTMLRGLPVLLLITTFALAQSAPPATAPSIAPTSQPAVPLDQSTPRGTMKLFFDSDARSDGSELKKILLGTTPAEKHVISAMADKTDADRELTDALIAKYPNPNRPDPRKEALVHLPEVLAKIDQSTEVITGDTATLTATDANARPFPLKRFDNNWCIPLNTFLSITDPDRLESSARAIDIQVQVMRDGARAIAAGKYPTEAEAVQDIKQKMVAAPLADHTAAATQPGK